MEDVGESGLTRSAKLGAVGKAVLKYYGMGFVPTPHVVPILTFSVFAPVNHILSLWNPQRYVVATSVLHTIAFVDTEMARPLREETKTNPIGEAIDAFRDKVYMRRTDAPPHCIHYASTR